VTPLDKAVSALRELADALEQGALGSRESEFATVEEACVALGIRPDVKHPIKAIKRKAKGRGYVRHEGYGVVIERKGLRKHVMSMRSL
jgi:hypothetical protein